MQHLLKLGASILLPQIEDRLALAVDPGYSQVLKYCKAQEEIKKNKLRKPGGSAEQFSLNEREGSQGVNKKAAGTGLVKFGL